MVSIFANDFAGDMKVVLEGRGGDWDEGKYWLGKIRDVCFGRGIPCLFVPAPWVNQLEGPQLAGNYPGPVSSILETTGFAIPRPDQRVRRRAVIDPDRRSAARQAGHR